LRDMAPAGLDRFRIRVPGFTVPVLRPEVYRVGTFVLASRFLISMKSKRFCEVNWTRSRREFTGKARVRKSKSDRDRTFARPGEIRDHRGME